MRIALLGSAPSSSSLAPFDDPSWQIWGCSPGAVQAARRVDAWFELHRWGDEASGFTRGYMDWVASLPCPVYMAEKVKDVPHSVRYPREEIIERFGSYFFTSSLSWMFALAITKEPREIALYGVDMSATEEYAQQRPGCHHFITLARSMGIQVTVPPQSDLLRPPMLYGISDHSPMYIKLAARKKELEQRLAANQAQYEQIVREQMFLKGALDDLTYIIHTWVD